MILPANWEQGNLSVIFNELLLTFSLNWNNVAFFDWSDSIPVRRKIKVLTVSKLIYWTTLTS